MNQQSIVEVAVGVVADKHNRVLVTQRAIDTHQGGKWEFPGGKCEVHENIIDALKRELEEELGIHVVRCEPLMNIKHTYPEKTVHLHIYRILEYSATASGREQQPLKWQSIDSLDPKDFPAANRGIIYALKLPQSCLITPELGDQNLDYYLMQLENVLQQGICLVQFRDHGLSKQNYLSTANAVQQLCAEYKAVCTLNMPIEWLSEIKTSGLHLSAPRLMVLAKTLGKRPESFGGWLSAACHNQKELHAAIKLEVDFVFLSSVTFTKSHSQAQPLGWSAFQQLASIAPMPVFALGGLTLADLKTVIQHGGQGVAGISAFWSVSN